MKENTNARRIGFAAFVLSFGILLSRLLGYLREAVIAYQHGAGPDTDAYNAAFLLPDLMNYFLAGGTLSITFIPLIAKYISNNDSKAANQLFSNVATIMGSMLLFAIILAEFFTIPLLSLLFPGFDEEQILITAKMTRIVLPAQIFHYIGGLFLATLMANAKFLPTAIAPVIYNASIITFGLLLGPKLGIKAFAIGALIGSFIGPFLIPALYLKNFIKFKPSFDLFNPDFKKYILLTLPLILGVSLTTVDEWIGRIIGSTMDSGTISHLNYARRLMLVPVAIIGQAAGQAALPFLSKLAAQNNFEELAQSLTKTLRSTLILALIISATLIALAKPTVAFIYQRGAFTSLDTLITTEILIFFAIGIFAWVIQMVAVRAFYAQQNTLKPMIITTMITFFSIPIYITLGNLLGPNGLALSATIGMSSQAIAILFFYAKTNPHFKPAKLLPALAPGFFLATIAGLTAYLALYLSTPIESLFNTPSINALLQLSIAGSLSLVTTLCASKYLIPDFYSTLSSIFARKFSKKK